MATLLSCTICEEPSAVGHIHHKEPTAYGGEDIEENTVGLCPSCHSLIHTVAHALRRSPDEASSLVTLKWLPGTKKYKKCIELATVITKKMLDPDQVDHKKLILNNVPSKVHLKLKEQARLSGVSLERYITEILIKQARKTF